MSKKVSDFFKTLPKFNKNSEIIQENLRTSAEVKKEKKGDFDINLDKFQQKLAKNDDKEFSSSEIRECRVILQDLNKKVQNGNSTINKSKTKSELKSCLSEIKEISIKNSPKPRKRPSNSSRKECKFCCKNFRQNYISDHINRVHSAEMKNEQNNCKICTRKFLNLNSLMYHMNRKHSKDFFSTPDNFECDFDGKIFKTRKTLQSHMKCHLSKGRCELCQKELTQMELGKHIRNVHTEDRIYQCQICQKTFKSVSVLNNHIQSHNKKFDCSKCSKIFSTQSYLNMHIKHYHENPNNFECESCGRKFNQKSNLKTHQKVHEKNRPQPYKCQRCDYLTGYKFSYIAHQKSHEREDKKIATMKNPIKCEKCLKFCKNKRALNDHMRFVHPEFPYQCDLCGMYVKIKSSLKQHFLVHLKNQNNL